MEGDALIQWPARVKMVFVAERMLTDLLTEGLVVGAVQCVEGLPPDAKMVMASYNEKRKAMALYFEHPSWPLASPGSVPVVTPVLQAVEAQLA